MDPEGGCVVQFHNNKGLEALWGVLGRTVHSVFCVCALNNVCNIVYLTA